MELYRRSSAGSKGIIMAHPRGRSNTCMYRLNAFEKLAARQYQ